MRSVSIHQWVVLTALLSTAHSLDNGVGRRPTLGWNSWNLYKGRLDESLVRSTAKLLVSTGLAAKGYIYVNMDDTWAAESRDTNGSLVPDPTKFQSPMNELVDALHADGLKFGIYTDVGWYTCARRPGTFGHEVDDANLFASWGVDFVKSDSCFTSPSKTVQPADGPRCYEDYQKFAKALNATGRHMVHSVKGPCGPAPGVCSPPDASSIAHLRRAAGDVQDNWKSMLRVLDDAAAVVNNTQPGFFADLDILEIGNGGLTTVEERAVFSLWCAVKSPLLLGNDLGAMNASTLETVSNDALLAVNQDGLGRAATRVANLTSGVQLWAGPLGERPGHNGAVNDYVVVAFNAGETMQTGVVIAWEAVGACPGATHGAHESSTRTPCAWDVRDVWLGNTSHAVPGHVVVDLAPHAAVALRLENQTSAVGVE
eukprot:m.165464 g.165464  ORF g.165464 m.165464 type:complete len:427 (-) comp12565_c0_seq1:2250-3530(-)